MKHILNINLGRVDYTFSLLCFVLWKKSWLAPNKQFFFFSLFFQIAVVPYKLALKETLYNGVIYDAESERYCMVDLRYWTCFRLSPCCPLLVCIQQV